MAVAPKPYSQSAELNRLDDVIERATTALQPKTAILSVVESAGGTDVVINDVAVTSSDVTVVGPVALDTPIPVSGIASLTSTSLEVLVATDDTRIFTSSTFNVLIDADKGYIVLPYAIPSNANVTLTLAGDV
jgi:hypothetical protein